METKTSFAEKIVDGLRKAANEIEKMRIQATLGEADIKSKMEQAQSAFFRILEEAKQGIEHSRNISSGAALQFKASLEEMKDELAREKALTKEEWEKRARNIGKILEEL